MWVDDLGDAAKILLRARGRALGSELSALAREHASSSSAQLADSVAQAPHTQKPALGLLLARVSLEEALTSKSRDMFAHFLFRYGAHLRTSISTPGLSAPERLALAIALEHTFAGLPTATDMQRTSASSVRQRLSGPSVQIDHWMTTVGLTEAAFLSAIEQFTRELGTQKPARVNTKKRVRKSAEQLITTSPIPTHLVPTWLSLTFSDNGDSLVAATANWRPSEIIESHSYSLEMGWSAYKEGKYLQARSAVDAVLAQVGPDWGPNSSADALRSWNWLRLVSELASIERGEIVDSRRSWTSVCEFAVRCVPDDEKISTWLENALGDFITSDLASIRALTAYSTRLIATLGHEEALSSYTNSEKASLRQAWKERYSLSGDDARSTAAAASSIIPRLKQLTQMLYLGARDSTATDRTLSEASHEFLNYLDEAESEFYDECLELLDDAQRLDTSDATNHRDLQDALAGLTEFQGRIANSGSSTLQDYVAPLVRITISRLEQATGRLGDLSRPEVRIRLSSAKLPFSAASGSTYDISFTVTNHGNTAAEQIRLEVRQPELGIDSAVELDSLGPGAESEVAVSVFASGKSRKAVTLECLTTWTDALLQQFNSAQQVSAEDQMPVTWSINDINPFNLGTISEPERLVGRADDLAALDALLAGKASAYITGHKRVGKTSLTRVLLRSVAQERGWAGSLLPLGRALGETQSAGDLVYALLDEVLDAGRTTYPHAFLNIEEVEAAADGNFARAANKWLRSAARALPKDGRVVIAIDDFDELPSHLVTGPQADSLFLFLRSLVDEPWLNLIVVGSEVLPSIIQAQAHKLNQVVPVSVTNFSTRSSTAELLQSPTSDRLEWVPASIDRMHYLCAGNPYYETLVAQRLWQMMRERYRSVVMASDVDEAAIFVARSASESNFVHLWADSTSGLAHTGRSAIVASAVLRSIARCGGDTLAPASPEEVTRLAQSWIQTATTDELLQAIAALTSRDIVRPGPSAGRLLISIPLVGVWLQEAGARALDGIYANSKHATATVRMITDSDLVSLARGLRYKGEQVTEIRIKAWLEQFGGNDSQYLAFKMLRRMIMDGYFTSTRIQNTELPRLSTAVNKLSAARMHIREANNQNVRNALLIDHGKAGDSTQGTLALLAKALKIKKANIVQLADLADRMKGVKSDVVLYLLDDYSGSGNHLSSELDKVTEVVLSMGDEWVEKTHVVVGACIVAEATSLASPTVPFSLETVYGRLLGERFRPFSEESGVYDSRKEKEDAEEMTMSIGNALLPNNPLGFGGAALLTLFEFNCPNNVAPIFWKAGEVAGRDWIPLFERST
ncbi:hypothetical protein CMMCAS02_11885 [Clavibacter michiganensis subsp. michiganensis]|nr:hypothetical protein [Clavibacter michiganensis subsp. michiganensis]SLK00601.1 AAA ATPase domain-containing protein [Clavibacter michiganensis]OQJ67403.1 hypothetical protein B5P23_08820 [Clavibacter michiganensis subsp. michiganensis]OUD83617.1 hypothetical protein CMMCAS02_11885 [Clavibacter michiganensis subsp. michiganensis]OUD92402.1 hypothetical protein CMMCAS03_06970 [Clavibacter michiganensis subsp. michiganensis]